MTSIRQIQARRIERVAIASQTRIRRPGQGEAAPWSFRARLVGDKCMVYQGYRQRITEAPVLCAPETGKEFSFDFADGRKVWTVFTYRTEYNTPGTFDSTLQSGSSVPDDDVTKRVIVICEMLEVDGSPRVFQRHFGDIVVIDFMNYGVCT
jgi:hypothetical protein